MLVRMPLLALGPVGIGHRLDMAAEPDLIGALAPLEFPGIAVGEPFLGQFDLPAFAHLLPEQPVHIADAVAIGRDLERGHGFEEARRKPSEAAIAQRRVGLEVDEVPEVDIEVLERLLHRLHEPDIAHRVAHEPADQELEAEIVDALVGGPPGFPRTLHPAVHDAVAHRIDRCSQPVVRTRDDRVLADRIGQFFQDLGLDGLDASGAALWRGSIVNDRLLRHVATQVS